jgi:hypothetical protein
MKHENIQPLIIDIVDKFSVFENQARKRFNVYKKKKYNIEDITYNLDKSVITMNKNYCFHQNLTESDDSEEDNNNNVINLNDDEDNFIDTTYSDINPKNSTKIKNYKKKVNKKNSENDELILDSNIDVDKIFKKFSLFA